MVNLDREPALPVEDTAAALEVPSLEQDHPTKQTNNAISNL